MCAAICALPVAELPVEHSIKLNVGGYVIFEMRTPSRGLTASGRVPAGYGPVHPTHLPAAGTAGFG